MASILRTLQPYNQSFAPNPSSSLKLSNEFNPNPTIQLQTGNISRRKATMASLSTVLLARETILNPKLAYAFDFRMVAPDQTFEEAESEIKGHAQQLLKVKTLIDSESWEAAQKDLRKSSGKLKQDIYTIIQAKPGSERPLLRKLYSNLFNNVTKLDYAARSKDMTRVLECYQNIVVTLDDILSRL
ncbi:psbQ-like protein 3, chloroplastic [Telopea speciosissima]|uniref:psbQ-like protein 3, chloroplastic n=1 Tax=Telopea speciosissima TaxID=54955 RepID=UPI001CC591ED|nr:psbQ-like protein 3, chloroplastic [Telopea speciosissima]XP_043694983.1 psbQ-like protein 3, chloroplastic [Telopea speciosissima]